MEVWIALFASLFISLVPFLYSFRKERKKNSKSLLQFCKENRFLCIATMILFFGCLIRTIGISSIPAGLNQDEASLGYDIYGLLHSGIDRNGISFPVHFIAWGSGQNALYGYLLAPSIALVGLTTFSLRFPMALMGCLSLLATYYFSKNIFGEKKSLAALFLFSFLPWHLMKSRWGLESNLFPDLIWIAMIFIYFYLVKGKKKFLVFSSILFGLSTYAYGTSYFFVPIYFFFIYGIFYWKKKISLRMLLTQLSIVFLISLPMILFVLINYFDLPEISVGMFTIPRLDYNRFVELTSLNGNLFTSIVENIKNFFGLLFTQKDGLVLNSISQFGIFQLISLPFIFYGLLQSVRTTKNNSTLWLIHLLALSSFLLLVLVPPNINRINVIWFPFYFYLAYGLVSFRERFHKMGLVLFTGYGILTCLFLGFYFTEYNQVIGSQTRASLEEAMNYARRTSYDYLYMDEMYIYYLYYTKMNPREYLKKRTIVKKEVMFQQIPSVGNVYFYLPSELEEGNCYIMLNEKVKSYDTTDWKIKKFPYYSVLTKGD